MLWSLREDDENDLSDEDAQESRVSLDYKNKMRSERQKDRDAFLAFENGIKFFLFNIKKMFIYYLIVMEFYLFFVVVII